MIVKNSIYKTYKFNFVSESLVEGNCMKKALDLSAGIGWRTARLGVNLKGQQKYWMVIQLVQVQVPHHNESSCLSG